MAARPLRGGLDRPVLPGRPLAWTLGGLSVVAFPLLASLAQMLRWKSDRPVRVHLRGVLEDLSTAFAQALLTLVFLPYHAWEMVHAIGLTLVRLVVTQRRLLDWETAATQAARATGLLNKGVRAFVVEMAASPLAALGLLVLVSTLRPAAFFLSLPFSLLWIAAPVIAYWLSQPTGSSHRELSAEPRLPDPGREPWHTSSARDAGDHGLPPDNVQEGRWPSCSTGPRRRTSGCPSSRRSRRTTSVSCLSPSCSKGSTRR